MKLVIANSALELVPNEIKEHRQVKSRKSKGHSWEILDSTFHYSAMRKLNEHESRGRPDIPHFCLLEALESPLALEDHLEVHMHTRSDDWISFRPGTHLPRNQERFKGLMAKLLKEKKREKWVRYEGKRTLPQLLDSFDVPNVALSQNGKMVKVNKIPSFFEDYEDVVLVVGGFPHGDFSQDDYNSFDQVFSIYDKTMNAWTALSRLLCSFEAKLL